MSGSFHLKLETKSFVHTKFVLQHFVRNLKFGETTFSGARLKELSITYKHNKDKTRLLFTSSQKFGSDVVSKI